jgi:hypothetical protein
MSAVCNLLTSGTLASAYIKPWFVDANLNLIAGTASLTVHTGVNTLSTTSEIAPLGTSYVIPQLVNAFDTGTTLDGYWDDVLLSFGDTVPTYFDGDQSGYSWIGVPGNSFSAQSLPTIDPSTQYSIVERQDSAGNPNAYFITIVVKPEQLTPASNTTAILAAIDSVKPGGVLINLIASDSPTWGSATRTWGGVTAGTTWGTVVSGDV